MRAITLAPLTPTHAILKVHALCPTPERFYVMRSQLFLIHSFSSMLIRLFLDPLPWPEGSYKIGSVRPSVRPSFLPSVRTFSRDWLISFF